MRARLMVALVALSFLLGSAGCGPLANLATTSTTDFYIRVINGSPDAGALDIRLNSTTGQAIASTIKYGTVGSYTAIASGTYSLLVLAAGGTTAKLDCASASLAGGYYYTLVIAGKVAKGIGTSAGLQCDLFNEPTFATPTGDYTLSFHHASPAANAIGASTVSFGTFTPGTATYSDPLGTASYTGLISSGLVAGSYYTYVATGVTAAPGIGFWVASQTSTAPTSVLGTILPSAGQAGAAGVSGATDTTNILPSGSRINYSIYIVDGADTTSSLIGAFD